MTTIGIVHPGAMGAAIAGLLTDGGHRVLWAGQGRSTATHDRADAAGLEDVGTVSAVCSDAEVVLSVCPPHAALDVAEEVARTGFAGVFVDANAVAPATGDLSLRRVTGATGVDGGILGPPPAPDRSTRLYLAGDGTGGAADRAAATIAGWFDGTPLEVHVLDQPAPAASAVKVAYSAWTKGSSALLMAVRAFARSTGVEGALVDAWSWSHPGLDERNHGDVRNVAAKAWRFDGEMAGIADAFAAEHLPEGYHRAAAETYRRLASLQHEQDVVLDQLLELLVAGGTDDGTDGTSGANARQ